MFTENREQRAENSEQRTASREQRAENSEQRPENREQRAETREQKTANRKQCRREPQQFFLHKLNLPLFGVSKQSN
ncbi:MAG: hypothetical protein EAZ91_12375 [Cytophagales bacterium]|nr:MAG: hypothetical protein EAZ91_12375 [Cytophagales bacterium]